MMQWRRPWWTRQMTSQAEGRCHFWSKQLRATVTQDTSNLSCLHVSISIRLLLYASTRSTSITYFPHFVLSGLGISNGERWIQLRRFTLTTLKDFGMGRKGMEEWIQEESKHLRARIDTFKGVFSACCCKSTYFTWGWCEGGLFHNLSSKVYFVWCWRSRGFLLCMFSKVNKILPKKCQSSLTPEWVRTPSETNTLNKQIKTWWFVIGQKLRRVCGCCVEFLSVFIITH